MTAQEVGKEIQDRIVPQLRELGIEAFVLTGYLSDGDGKVSRVTLGTSGDNPAYDDGLRKMLVLGNAWGAGQL